MLILKFLASFFKNFKYGLQQRSCLGRQAWSGFHVIQYNGHD